MRKIRETLETRLARLERVVGSLLTFLAAVEIIGPEDFGSLVRELEAPRCGSCPTDGASARTPEPDKPP